MNEKKISYLDTSAWIRSSFTVSPDSRRVAYTAMKDGGQLVVLDGVEQPLYDGIGSLVFSPDGLQVAYVAMSGNRQSVVLEGREGKWIDDVLKSTLNFSPDGRHLVYGARADGGEFIVVDEEEGVHYNSLITLGGGGIIFDPSSRFHFLALRDRDIYLVEG